MWPEGQYNGDSILSKLQGGFLLLYIHHLAENKNHYYDDISCKTVACWSVAPRRFFYIKRHKEALGQHTTQASCELLYQDKRWYCPNHPDIAGCVDFLHNATNKQKENPYSTCAGAGDSRSWVICPQETNPERYCLMYDNSYCKIVGDLCDPDGFVKPEYPYCK